MPILQEDVKTFAEYCVRIRSTYRHFKTLHTESNFEIFEKISPVFFGDLCQMFLEYIPLQVCKMTDPDKMGQKENLTVAYFANNADFPSDHSKLKKLRQLSDKMHKFREKIQPARHKFIAHLDREAILKGQSLGAASEDEWNEFWLDLQDFVELIYMRYIDLDCSLYINAVGVSDADQLIKVIEDTKYFDHVPHLDLQNTKR